MKLLNNKTNIKSAIPANIKIAAKLYLLVVGIYTLFRLGLLLVCFQKLGNATFAEVSSINASASAFVLIRAIDSGRTLFSIY